MFICDYCENGYYKASEMWANDYFMTRKIWQHDIFGFATALLIMITLIINGKWYKWREQEYY